MNKKIVLHIGSFVLLLLFLVSTYFLFEGQTLLRLLTELLDKPNWVILLLVGYSFSFLLKAIAWRYYLEKKLPLTTCLHGIWYSLFINHLAPIKIGDLARIYVASSSKNVTREEAIHSVAVMRSFDIMLLLLISGVGVLFFMDSFVFRFRLWHILVGITILLVGFSLVLKKKAAPFFEKQWRRFVNVMKGKYGVLILLLVLFSWFAEGVVIYSLSHFFTPSLSFISSVWVNSLTVGGGVFQITPGGVGTYESIMSFSLFLLGFSLQDSYHLSLLSHGFKFLFSYIVGLYVLIASPIQLKKVKELLVNRRKGM